MTPNTSERNHEILVSHVGEKELIRRVVKPLFNPRDDVQGVGDDCAMITGQNREVWLFSTDRVPADLIAFRLGIIDYQGIGRYLAALNISDICACGGQPVALLLNVGLPSSLSLADFEDLCRGFEDLAAKYGCSVLGGDTSSSNELSLSAVAVGRCIADEVLTRRGASPGDTIFTSKPLGLTPAAFAYHLGPNLSADLPPEEVQLLNRQFSDIEPLPSLGRQLAASGQCTSCMDNTDGLGQSLVELAAASFTAFVVVDRMVQLEPVVLQIARCRGADPVSLALGPGADFSLVGTLRGSWSQEDVSRVYGPSVKIIGHVEAGEGVYRDGEDGRNPLDVVGWNYFAQESP